MTGLLGSRDERESNTWWWGGRSRRVQVGSVGPLAAAGPDFADAESAGLDTACGGWCSGGDRRAPAAHSAITDRPAPRHCPPTSRSSPLQAYPRDIPTVASPRQAARPGTPSPLGSHDAPGLTRHRDTPGRAILCRPTYLTRPTRGRPPCPRAPDHSARSTRRPYSIPSRLTSQSVPTDTLIRHYPRPPTRHTRAAHSYPPDNPALAASIDNPGRRVRTAPDRHPSGPARTTHLYVASHPVRLS